MGRSPVVIRRIYYWVDILGMTKLLKVFFCILGSLLVGFGLGMMMASYLGATITGIKYWLMVSGILILGGFFLGLSFIKKVSKKDVMPKIKTMQEEKELFSNEINK